MADDSKINLLLIHGYLKGTGYRLDEAENGAIAVAKIKAEKYDLVLMDIQMPMMDGLEATRAIRDWARERGLARTPIVALTASALDEDVRRTLEAGVDTHLSKPIKKALMNVHHCFTTDGLMSMDEAARCRPIQGLAAQHGVRAISHPPLQGARPRR
jgi:CheY-like chemotaxis protein